MQTNKINIKLGFLAIALFTCLNISGQSDIIYTSSGKEFISKISSISEKGVTFTDLQSNTVKTIQKDRVFMVKFKDGTKEVFGLKDLPFKHMKNVKDVEVELNIGNFEVTKNIRDKKLDLIFVIESKDENGVFYEQKYYYKDDSLENMKKNVGTIIWNEKKLTNKLSISEENFTDYFAIGKIEFRFKFLISYIMTKAGAQTEETITDIPVTISDSTSKIIFSITPNFYKDTSGLINSTELGLDVSYKLE